MSLLSQASLCVTPSAYKEGKLYSVIPSDGSGDLSVTRATTATRVNSAGLVELVPYNLLQYSEDFTNAAWISGGGTITSNAAIAPNGTQTADEFSSGVYCLQGSVQGVSTASVYFKKTTSNIAYIRMDAVNSIYIEYNINTGVVSSVPSGYTATIEDAGNGWYRCTATATSPSSNNIILFIGPCLIWGAQLNEGTIKPYQKTETRLNIPRLDYSNGTCPSILVEPQRTNVLLYSNNFTNYPTWYFSNTLGTLTANDTISPQGINNATKIHFVDGVSDFIQQISIPSGTSRVFSIYLKGTIGETINIGFGGGSTQTITFTGDWQRCIVTSTTGTYVWIGTWGGMTARDLWMYGSQCEVGSYATSYIPTTSASVTRNADVISKMGISSLIGQTEGTMFLDIDFNNITQVAGVDTLMTLNNGTTDNEISILLDTPAGAPKTFLGYIRNAASNQAIIYAASPITTTRYKVAFSYKLNDVVLYINGTQIGTDTSATIPSTTALSLSSRSDNSFLNIQQEYVQAAALWKTRLTNAQLAQLTTI